MVNPLIIVLVSLSLAYLCAEIVRRLGLPRVVGQISAGLILGIPLIKEYLFVNQNIQILSFLGNLGIVLLFYYVGLETNIKNFTKNINEFILVSLFNTLIPLILGFLVMKFLFDFSILVSLIIGISLAVSAQSVSLDILDELKLLKSKIGRLIIGSGAVDDVIELILVGILFSIFHVAGSKPTLTKLLIDILYFLIIIIIARLWVIPHGLKFFDRQKSSTSRFTGALLLVLLIASLAEFFGIGLLIGAMIAGILVRQTIMKDITIPDQEEHDIAKSLHIISFGFLIPLFFVSVGLQVDLSLLLEEFWFILLLLAIALGGTIGGSMLGVVLSGGTAKEGFKLGWGLRPKGDIELVIASLALATKIISNDVFTALVILSLLTTIIAPIMLKYLVTRTKSKNLKRTRRAAG